MTSVNNKMRINEGVLYIKMHFRYKVKPPIMHFNTVDNSEEGGGMEVWNELLNMGEAVQTTPTEAWRREDKQDVELRKCKLTDISETETPNNAGRQIYVIVDA